MLQKLSGVGASFCKLFDHYNFFHESYPKSGADPGGLLLLLIPFLNSILLVLLTQFHSPVETAGIHTTKLIEEDSNPVIYTNLHHVNTSQFYH